MPKKPPQNPEMEKHPNRFNVSNPEYGRSCNVDVHSCRKPREFSQYINTSCQRSLWSEWQSNERGHTLNMTSRELLCVCVSV